MRRAIEEGPQFFEWLVKLKDGDLLWNEVNLIATSLPGKECVIAIARDISLRKQAEEAFEKHSKRLEEMVEQRTAKLSMVNNHLKQEIENRKLTEEALRESEQKYRGLVETMAEGLAIQDGNGLIIYVNNRFCKMTGYQQHEVIGKKIIDFLDERNKQIVKGEIAKRRKGVPAQSYETEIIRKDGHHISVFLSPRDILDSDGQFKGSFAVFTDISSRKQAEEALQNAHSELEQKVEERTAELSETNEQLKKEIRDRKRAEEILKEREKDLEGKGIRLEELNAALKILLEKRDEDREELEEKVVANVKEMVLPYVVKLKSTGLGALQETFTDIIESNLDAIISPFLRKLSSKYLNLTPTELRVADLVKHGLSTKEIGNLLNSSPETITRHRKSIRKKLQLKDKKSNLRTHLLSLQ